MNTYSVSPPERHTCYVQVRLCQITFLGDIFDDLLLFYLYFIFVKELIWTYGCVFSQSSHH